MGEFQASPVSRSKTKTKEVVIIRNISLHITFEQVPLQPPPQHNHKTQGKPKENGTREWDGFRHPPVSLSKTEVAGVVITRSIMLHITFEEVPLQPPSTGTKHKEHVRKTARVNGRVSGIHPKLQKLSSLAVSFCTSLSRRSLCSPPQHSHKI